MLTKCNYRHICALCDNLLLSLSSSNKDFVAISALHVINEHPVNTSIYSTSPSLLLAFIKFIAISSHRLFKSFWGLPLRYEHAIEETVDVLLFSHLLCHEHFTTQSDFYFGDLPNSFLSSGKKCALVLLDHCKEPLSSKQRQLFAHHCHRFIAPRLLKPWHEFTIIFKQCNLFIILLLKLASSSDQYRNILVVDALSSKTAANLRYLRAIKYYLSRLKPSTVIVTYEGHAWERLVFSSARSYNPATFCVAYQHTIIFPLQHALRRSLGKHYDPDLILFAGHFASIWFAKNSNFYPRSYVVGTPRYTSIASSTALGISHPNNKKSCLLLPDGTIGECTSFLSFAVVCAIAKPSINFIFRLHPVASFQEVCRSCSFDASNLPSNVTISSQSLEDDFAEAQWAIYRGSASAVRAAMAGLRPLYYNNVPCELSVDSLHHLPFWRVTVKTPFDVCNVISDDLSRRTDLVEADFTLVHHLMRKFFSPFDSHSFVALSCPTP